MDKTEMREFLTELLLDTEDRGVDYIKTFEEASLLTYDEGLIVQMEDGSRFYISIQKA
jgi:hypothetical protein